MQVPTPIDEKLEFSYWLLLWFVIVCGFAIYIMFYSDRGEIVQIISEERISNQHIIGEKRESKAWQSVASERRFFTKLYAESERLFRFPFDDVPQFEEIVKDMEKYGMLIDYRISYIVHVFPFLLVFLMVTVFDGLMSREVEKKTYSFSSPVIHNIGVSYIFLPSVFFTLIILFIPITINIFYFLFLTTCSIVGLWISIAHFSKRL